MAVGGGGGFIRPTAPGESIRPVSLPTAAPTRTYLCSISHGTGRRKTNKKRKERKEKKQRRLRAVLAAGLGRVSMEEERERDEGRLRLRWGGLWMRQTARQAGSCLMRAGQSVI